jgi:Amt family ammonium transporter
MPEIDKPRGGGMPEAQKAVQALQAGTDVLFLLVGTVLVLAMHGGLALAEAGSVRPKAQADTFSRILVGLAVSVLAYFFVGYGVAYGVRFLVGARELSGGAGFEAQGLTLAKFAFLCAVAALVPAIVSGGIAERARLLPHCVAAMLIAGLVYPFLEGLVWGRGLRLQGLLQGYFGAQFHDFAGSVVVHATGGWLAYAAIRRLGPRLGRYEPGGALGLAPSSLPMVVLGTWLLALGWLGFAAMSAYTVKDATGLAVLNMLMAMCGGILAALIAGDGDPFLVHNGALAGLVAACAGADVMHPVGALLVGGVAGILLVFGRHAMADPKWRLDDVRGVWALHGLCGLWGGIACGIFGLAAFGGLGGVSFRAQVAGSVLAAAYALLVGAAIYAMVDVLLGLRLPPDDERRGAERKVTTAGAGVGESGRAQEAGLGRL